MKQSHWSREVNRLFATRPPSSPSAWSHLTVSPRSTEGLLLRYLYLTLPRGEEADPHFLLSLISPALFHLQKANSSSLPLPYWLHYVLQPRVGQEAISPWREAEARRLSPLLREEQDPDRLAEAVFRQTALDLDCLPTESEEDFQPSCAVIRSLGEASPLSWMTFLVERLRILGLPARLLRLDFPSTPRMYGAEYWNGRSWNSLGLPPLPRDRHALYVSTFCRSPLSLYHCFPHSLPHFEREESLLELNRSRSYTPTTLLSTHGKSLEVADPGYFLRPLLRSVAPTEEVELGFGLLALRPPGTKQAFRIQPLASSQSTPLPIFHPPFPAQNVPAPRRFLQQREQHLTALLSDPLACQYEIQAFLRMAGQQQALLLDWFRETKIAHILLSRMRQLQVWSPARLASVSPEALDDLKPFQPLGGRAMTELEAHYLYQNQLDAEAPSAWLHPLRQQILSFLKSRQHGPLRPGDCLRLVLDLSQQQEGDDSPVRCSPLALGLPLLSQTQEPGDYDDRPKLQPRQQKVLAVAIARASGYPARLHPFSHEVEIFDEVKWSAYPLEAKGQAKPAFFLAVLSPEGELLYPFPDEKEAPAEEGDVARKLREAREAQEQKAPDALPLLEEGPWTLPPDCCRYPIENDAILGRDLLLDGYDLPCLLLRAGQILCLPKGNYLFHHLADGQWTSTSTGCQGGKKIKREESAF